MSEGEKVISYTQLGKIKLKSGIFGSTRDPSVDLERETTDFINSQKANFNQKVSNNFDIDSEEFTKFEFFSLQKRAKKVDDAGDIIDGSKAAFRSESRVTLLYLKPRSLIIFQTSYNFVITDATSCCGGNGVLYYSGGRNYNLEEIYFNKITTVGASHDEDTYKVINEGCGSGSEAQYTSESDGFVIRAGEAFHVFASDKETQELKDARKLINDKISETN